MKNENHSNRLLRCCFISIILFCSSVSAAENNFKESTNSHAKRTGIGLTLGQPSGLTLKHWFDSTSAFDFRVGEGYVGSITVQGDYVKTFHSFNNGKLLFPLYIGGGLGVGLGSRYHKRDYYYHGYYDGPGISLRMPVGISCVFVTAPFDIFLEIAPSLLISDDYTRFGFEPSLGARYYF